MKKREYLESMHRLYRYIYSRHGDKDSYTFQEDSAVVKSFLTEFPKAFSVDEKAYQSALPSIIARSQALLRDGNSIDELLFGLSLVALRKTKTVSPFFGIRMVLWSLRGPLCIAPEQERS